LRQKKAWIFSGGAAAVVLVASAIYLPPMLNGHDATTEAAVTHVVVTPSPNRTYPAVTNFYKQAGPPAGSPLEKVAPQTLTISADTTGTKLSASQIGLSFEATDLDNEILNADNANLVEILKGLGQPVMRFGGNSVDRRFWWSSSNEPIPASYAGDKAHPVRSASPADFTRIKGLLDKADAYISLTVDLGHYDPARAADMVKNASQIFGKRLVAVTIGNEPNGYAANGIRPGGYTMDDFLKDAKTYADAMYAVAPNVPISGPGTYAESWWGPFTKLDIKQKKILTFHHYPLSDCKASVPGDAPTMANLMSKGMHDRSVSYHKFALKSGNAANVPTWLPETGISACPGSNETSKTYASALWSSDFALSAALLGVQQADFHSSMVTCKGGPPMSAICAEGAYLQPTGPMDERANYFGLSMVGTIGGGDFLKTKNDGGGLSYGYAVKKADGSTTVVLINENNPKTAAQTQVTLELPNIPVTATMTQMTGPSYESQDGARIDGKDAAPVAENKRPAPMKFAPGKQTQTFPLTAGTVTVMNFKY
jgi:hypothetical protein